MKTLVIALITFSWIPCSTALSQKDPPKTAPDLELLDVKLVPMASVPSFTPPQSVDDAVRQAERAVASVNAPQSRYLHPERYAAIVAFLAEAIESFADQPDRHRLHALRAQTQNAVGAAEPLGDITTAISLDPSNAGYLRARAQMWTREDADKVVSDYLRALTLEPNHPAIASGLALALVNAEREEEAVGLLTLAAALHPENVATSSALVESLRDAGRLNEALIESNRGVQLKNLHPQTFINRAAVFQELERYHEAVEALEDAKTKWPLAVQLHLRLQAAYREYISNHHAVDQMEFGRHQLVLYKLNRALAEGTDPLLIHQRGVVHCYLGMYTEALNDFESAALKLPEFDACQNYIRRVLGMMKRTGEIKDASTIPLPLASEAEPTPDDQIMKSFHTGDPQFMLEQMPDKLRTYVDEVELKKRLQRIAHHWPPLSESEISSREDHPTVGDLQQTLILKFREDSDARAVITLARTPDGKFLGFEFESGRMRLGSLTALKNVDEIPGITRKLIEAFRDNDSNAFVELMGSKSRVEKLRVEKFLQMAAPAFGSVKKIKFIDAVIELPEYTDKIPGIVGIALGECDDGKLYTVCVRFLPGTRLEMSNFVVGNEINLHYSTSHKRNDERLAAAVVAENQSDFGSLVHSSMIDDFGDPNLRQLICQSSLAEIGTFKKVFDISSCSAVRIQKGVFSRQSFFDAKYEQALIAFDAKWSYGTLDSCLQQRSFLNNVVFANDSIGEWFIETGKEDLAKYVSGSPKTVLNTLQQYEGWEERNVESFTNLCNKVNEEYGELKKIEHRESTFNKETRHWTIRFDLVFEKREHATGYAEYAIKNASPALFQISFD